MDVAANNVERNLLARVSARKETPRRWSLVLDADLSAFLSLPRRGWFGA